MTDVAITCSCCGLQLVILENQLLLECPACGTRNARPKAQGPTLDVLKRAVSQRLACDFKNAEDSYQAVLRSYPDEHEALWGRLLCRYGVEYVTDPKTGRILPTVHFARRRPMRTVMDFHNACAHAPEEVAERYRTDAEYIDEAQNRIRELAQGQPEYDVFICHKATRPDTEDKTEDFHRAYKIFNFLKEKHIRAFFAPESLTDVAGAKYEAAIYHALHTAKVMLIVCSNGEWLKTPWVHSEWSRFLGMMDAEEAAVERRIVPLMYGGFKARELPLELAGFQGLTMEEPDAYNRMVAAIREVVKEEKRFPNLDTFVKADAVKTLNNTLLGVGAKVQEQSVQLKDKAVAVGKAAVTAIKEKQAAKKEAVSQAAAMQEAAVEAVLAQTRATPPGKAVVEMPPPAAGCEKWPDCTGCSRQAGCSKGENPLTLRCGALDGPAASAAWGKAATINVYGSTEVLVVSDKELKSDLSMAIVLFLIGLVLIAAVVGAAMCIIAACMYFQARKKGGEIHRFTVRPGGRYQLYWQTVQTGNASRKVLASRELPPEETPVPATPEGAPASTLPEEMLNAIPDMPAISVDMPAVSVDMPQMPDWATQPVDPDAALRQPPANE